MSRCTARSRHRLSKKNVRIGTIDDTPLDNVTFSVDPPSAESRLNPLLEHTKVTITMNVRVDPTALPDGEKHDATITVQASAARNTAAVSVHVDKTMLPQSSISVPTSRWRAAPRTRLSYRPAV